MRGSEILWEQGVGQFELWTGRMAPYKVMREMVMRRTLPKYQAGQTDQKKKGRSESKTDS